MTTILTEGNKFFIGRIIFKTDFCRCEEVKTFNKNTAGTPILNMENKIFIGRINFKNRILDDARKSGDISKFREAGTKPVCLAGLLFIWLLAGGYVVTKCVTGL